ncbi:RsiV family protein [Haloimpatiens lingqiaonensis]|uniref:RsiV family protein n=1 Tax=Haloimpatiens lingqiaonensis TaxID=1380675 RepID=UPI001FA97589|nr:RsiV family protein [Haloimpatiens lingqiaonensis]
MYNCFYCYNCPYYYMCNTCKSYYDKDEYFQYDLFRQDTNIKNTLPKNTENTNDGKVLLENQTINPQTFKISYPFIDNPKQDETKNIINNEIINTTLALFKDQVLIPEKIDFAEIISFYEVPLNEKGLLSILFGIYTYVNKAAHGFTKYASLTIDLKSGKVYTFEDLFNPKFYYKPILDDLAKKYIMENNIPLINEYNGIRENQEFYLTPNSLVIYYQVYEYTPYSHGLFKIEIPYEKIKTILYPGSPIQRLL